MSVLKGNNPVYRGRTLRHTSHGLTSTKENATSTSGPGILLDTDPRTAEGHPNYPVRLPTLRPYSLHRRGERRNGADGRALAAADAELTRPT